MCACSCAYGRSVVLGKKGLSSERAVMTDRPGRARVRVSFSRSQKEKMLDRSLCSQFSILDSRKSCSSTIHRIFSVMMALRARVEGRGSKV